MFKMSDNCVTPCICVAYFILYILIISESYHYSVNMFLLFMHTALVIFDYYCRVNRKRNIDTKAYTHMCRYGYQQNPLKLVDMILK